MPPGVETEKIKQNVLDNKLKQLRFGLAELVNGVWSRYEYIYWIPLRLPQKTKPLVDIQSQVVR